MKLMLERLRRRAVERALDRLSATPLPPGVFGERQDGNFILSGRGLIRRAITDSRLRRFGR